MNAVYGLLCLGSGLLAAYAVRNRLNPEHFQGGRHANLNGLRGFLAFFVFISHAATWQLYLEDGQWRASALPSFTIPGQTSIVLFFMTTGFLFGIKIIDSKKQSIDWIKLYCSRILRLYPVYLFAILILFLIIFSTSIQEKSLTEEFEILPYIKWMLFTIPGAPPLNNISETNIIMAGVTWPLTFEWAFYFSLPVIATVLGGKKSWLAIIFGTTLLGITLYFIPFYGLVYFMFSIGILSAMLDRHTKLQKILNQKTFGILATGLLIANGFINKETSYNITSVIIIGISFLVFATGNDLFGILTKKFTLAFGLGTYSIYLLHGPLLYITLKTAQSNSHYFYKNNDFFWIIIVVISPILVLLSIFFYIFIEAPAMKHQGKFTELIRKILQFKFPKRII